MTPHTEPESLPKCAKCGGAKETISERTLCGEWVTCGLCGGTGRESLDAWARRTAPTLTDVQWRGVLSEPDVDGEISRGIESASVERTIARRVALLAELDRIAGELSIREQWALTDAATTGMLDVSDHTAAMRLLFTKAGFAGSRLYVLVTPLGRAVLARKAAQR